jgi:hypothetical protein
MKDLQTHYVPGTPQRYLYDEPASPARWNALTRVIGEFLRSYGDWGLKESTTVMLPLI